MILDMLILMAVYLITDVRQNSNTFNYYQPPSVILRILQNDGWGLKKQCFIFLIALAQLQPIKNIFN